MSIPATAQIKHNEDGVIALVLTGDWLLLGLQNLSHQLGGILAQEKKSSLMRVDARSLNSIDTAGALLLLQAMSRASIDVEALALSGMRTEDLALVRLVQRSLEPDHPRAPLHQSLRQMVIKVGAASQNALIQARTLLGFIGLTLATMLSVLIGRRKFRLTSCVFHMEQIGLDAVPIVTLLTFLVGAVVAFLGATVLRDFGAEIFTVELVSYSFLREFGVLLTAILLAGRSGSAFTAQIGSMKAREELDAIQAMGLDAIELLVLPRLFALLLMLPVLAFLGMLSGIIGGGIVGSMALDITPGMFISRLQEQTELRHFFVGMVKAPVFAFLIAVVGCLEGFKVEGSAESVGRHTTSAVVQAIFLVILFDAFFALVFMELLI